MRNQFPPSDRCDFCKRKATRQSDDGADLCKKCWKESIIRCTDCKKTMVWSTTVWYGMEDGKPRCQICDGRYSLTLPDPWLTSTSPSCVEGSN